VVVEAADLRVLGQAADIDEIAVDACEQHSLIPFQERLLGCGVPVLTACHPQRVPPHTAFRDAAQDGSDGEWAVGGGQVEEGELTAQPLHLRGMHSRRLDGPPREGVQPRRHEGVAFDQFEDASQQRLTGGRRGSQAGGGRHPGAVRVLQRDERLGHPPRRVVAQVVGDGVRAVVVEQRAVRKRRVKSLSGSE